MARKRKKVIVVSRLLDKDSKMMNEISEEKTIAPASSIFVQQQPALIKQARLWSVGDPYLYTLVTEIIENGRLLDSITTPYGIRWISWPIGKNSKQFLLNGKPVFINGIAEYEHLLGGSHAFSDEEIRSRVMQIKAAGFNAFRDAHHPHNLRVPALLG
jgi:beta-galactosidase/beta-glucuronidase